MRGLSPLRACYRSTSNKTGYRQLRCPPAAPPPPLLASCAAALLPAHQLAAQLSQATLEVEVGLRTRIVRLPCAGCCRCAGSLLPVSSRRWRRQTAASSSPVMSPRSLVTLSALWRLRSSPRQYTFHSYRTKDFSSANAENPKLLLCIVFA